MAKNKETTDLIQVGSMKVYQEFRNILVDGKNKFDMNPEFEQWPMAIIDKKDLKGVMNVRPDPDSVGEFLNPIELEMWQTRMREHIMLMNDLTADVFDIITYKWLQTSKSPESMIMITADDFLQLRGLQAKPGGLKKRDGTTARGGFSREKRELIRKHIGILKNTWIDVREMTLPTIENGKRLMKKFKAKSAAIIVSSIIDEIDENGREIPYAWRIRPGDVFAPFLLDAAARQTAWMSQMALQFDPHREKWEKRLTRYFAYQWRVRHDKGTFIAPIKVNTLLENAVQGTVDQNNPIKTKERLEKSLNKLRNHNIIKEWKYVGNEIDEKIIGQKGWWKNEEGCWQQWRIEVIPPSSLLEAYTQLKTKTQALADSDVKIDPSLEIALKFKRIRKDNKLTLADVSKEIEQVTGQIINVSTLSRIENGETKPRKKTQEILEQWLKRYS